MKKVGRNLTLRKVVLAYISFPQLSAAVANEVGEQLYQKCIACDSFGYNRTGPDNCGVIGRLAGSIDDFEYTDAMRSSKLIWTSNNLDLFLAAPLDLVPGTSMGFIGVKDAEQRAALIVYIQDQQNSRSCNE